MGISPQFRCKGEWVGEGSAFVKVEGDLDMATSMHLRDVLDKLGKRGIARHLVIDLSLCSFVDSTGLALLVAAQRGAAAPLDLVAGDPQILRLLSITAMDRLFRVHATRAEALDSLRGRLGELCSVAGETLHTGEICA
jgi:anti-anti-sigma factor